MHTAIMAIITTSINRVIKIIEKRALTSGRGHVTCSMLIKVFLNLEEY